jgi:hypothetical protein
MPDQPIDDTGGALEGVIKPPHGGELRPWGKGVSGNPGGRSDAMKRALRLARDTSHEAMELLLEMMRDKNEDPRIRFACATAVLDRGLGKPTAGLPVADHTPGSADLSHLTPQQRRELSATLARVRQIAFGEEPITDDGDDE